MPLTPMFNNPGTPGTPAGSVGTADNLSSSLVTETTSGLVNNAGNIDRQYSAVFAPGRTGAIYVSDPSVEQLLSQVVQLLQANLLAMTANNALLSQIVGSGSRISPTLKNADELEANDLILRVLKIQGPLGATGIGGLEQDQNTLQ